MKHWTDLVLSNSVSDYLALMLTHKKRMLTCRFVRTENAPNISIIVSNRLLNDQNASNCFLS